MPMVDDDDDDDDDDDGARDNRIRRRRVTTCATASYTKQAIKNALAMMDAIMMR